MREIKFRAWHKKNKKMYVVSDLHMATLMNGGIWATVNGRSAIENKEIKVQIQPKDIELMQYTGMKDKNGKEIYEGDLLQDSEDIAKAAFEMGQFMAFYKTMKGEWKPYGTLLKYMVDHDGEVIGNIRDNPELIMV